MLSKKAIRILLYISGGLSVILLVFYIYYGLATRVSEPDIAGLDSITMERISEGTDSFSCKNGRLWKVREGWWEMHLEGSPYEIGYAHGLLTEELSYGQEKAFLERLEELIPSKFYQRFMLSFVRIFNRDLEDYVSDEYKQEIFGISRFASPEFDFIGPSYARMLNYHAAHDLGHAVQNMNLVACTAFGAWDGHSADSGLILGRNFDFYINDDFARNKILCFINPDSGYSFVSVTWAGFAGVVSGMNEKGLTVTLNAAKSSVPSGARTPVSLLAREILQYASTIDEAYRIAESRETFVAESFLVGSAADSKAVIIEKSPEKTAIFDPGRDHIIATNHFQSDAFLNDPLNIENMENETSVYRFKRVEELLAANPSVSPEIAAGILRDDKGLLGKDIGLGNEKAVNQYIAHHSIIFQPTKRRIWVAGPPYQLGEYYAYVIDTLRNSVSSLWISVKLMEISTTEGHRENVIATDSILLTQTYPQLLKYRNLADQIMSGHYKDGDADSLILYNPEFFHTYRILGDYFSAKGEEQRAEKYYRMSLEKEAPSAEERRAVVVGR